MRRLSALATLMIVVAYVAILLGLIRLALDPTVSLPLGFLLLMAFVVTVTGPVVRLVGWSLERGPRSERRSSDRPRRGSKAQRRGLDRVG